MGRLKISLFGRLCVQGDDDTLPGLDARKAQELLCYTLLFAERPHYREKLANLLWENSSPALSKQYLRQTLWQLQSSLGDDSSNGSGLLIVESDWVRINPDADYWADVAEFEQAYARSRGTRGSELDDEKANALEKAVCLYRGDLLENWYQDWCILARERFQSMYLAMLDKLMSYCEAHQDFDRGIDYGDQILNIDVARERTYRRLMRLRCLAGDRTGAIRQFERCKEVLDHELGVEPAGQTVALYERIRDDEPFPLNSHSTNGHIISGNADTVGEVLSRLEHMRATLLKAQRQVEEDIKVVKKAITGQR